MKIVIVDGYALNPGDMSWDSIYSLGETTIYERTDVQDIVSRCLDADIILTNKVPFSKQTLAQLPKLRFIGVTATGYNIIDTEAARQQGILVTNIPAYSTASVAQTVMALLLSVTNRVEHYTQQITREKRWSNNADFCYWDTPLTELTGKRMGIYGYGRIGAQVAVLAQALGMEVCVHTSKDADCLPAGIQKLTGQDFWSSCDVISLHCPLTPQTNHLVNASTLALVKPNMILINTARGPLVDEEAIARALHDGRLAAFCADVLSHEPALADNPLLSAPNVFLTPHIAWATLEARQRLMDILIANIRSFIEGNPINVVN